MLLSVIPILEHAEDIASRRLCFARLTGESALRLPADVARHELLRHCVANVMCQHMHGWHVQVLQQAFRHISIRVDAVRGRVQPSRLVTEAKACRSGPQSEGGPCQEAASSAHRLWHVLGEFAQH